MLRPQLTSTPGGLFRLWLIPADGFLADVRLGARGLNQVVTESSDVVADELRNSLAGRYAFLEEIDDP
jgi:hypothetical protein